MMNLSSATDLFHVASGNTGNSINLTLEAAGGPLLLSCVRASGGCEFARGAASTNSSSLLSDSGAFSSAASRAAPRLAAPLGVAVAGGALAHRGLNINTRAAVIITASVQETVVGRTITPNSVTGLMSSSFDCSNLATSVPATTCDHTCKQ